MLRIVRFEIDSEAFYEAYKSSESTVKRIQDAGDLDSNCDVYASKAMSTTSSDYFNVEAGLRSLFGDQTKWKVIDYSDNYALVRTRAPVDYDYGYCVQVGVVTTEFGEERLVAMPKDRVEYQSGRYGSGMFSAVDCG
jgi:hypothetical protein